MANGGKRIGALETTCRILREMESGDLVSVTDVAARVGVSKGTVHNHLSTLVANDLAVKRDGQYRLSLRFFEVGNAVRDSYQRDAVIPTIDRLAAETNGRAHFVVHQHDHAFCLHWSGSVDGWDDRSTRIRTPLDETAPGLAILAEYPDERVRDEVESWDGETKNRLDEIRGRGYAVGRTVLRNAELRSIATAIRLDDGVLGAVSVALDPSQADEDAFTTEFPNRVRKAANAIKVNSTLSG
ncbi:MAG: IclR family transcriptional regulator [Haloferacaceae archaeon]